MTLRIQLRAAPDRRPGHGQLLLSGWEHACEKLELSVQRNRDEYYLDDNGDWSSTPVHHPLGEPREDGEGRWLIEVGPWLVDPLVRGTGMAYQATLKNINAQTDCAVISMTGPLLSSQAAGHSASIEKKTAHASTASSAPELPAVGPDSEPEPAVLPPVPESPPAPRASRWWLWLLLTVLLLGLAGALAWWWQSRPADGSTSLTDAGDSTPCGTGRMASTDDDLLFIRTCLNAQPSSQDVLTVIAAAKQAKRCNLVQRLYAHKAQAGDVAVALAYAREYDPQSFTGGCIEAADADTAIYWYEIVTEHDPDQHEARARLEELNR